MTLGKPIPTNELKEKLRNIDEYISHEIYDVKSYSIFGKILANRLREPEITPKGFALEAELLLYDAERGIDNYTKRPLPEGIKFRSNEHYEYFGREIPTIAKAICPKDFAKEVWEFYKSRKVKPFSRIRTK